MTMVEKGGSVRRRAVRTLEPDEALIALFIGAMNAKTTSRAKNWLAPII
jgi:hypothetical protein